MLTLETKRPLAVALIGYGYAGRTFHAPLIQAVPGLTLRVVASSDAAKVHVDWPEVEVVSDPLRAITVADVDLVVIASPNDSHAPLAQATIAAGRHVVIDKPFTLSLAQARALVRQANEQQVLLSVFQNRRWDSDFLAIRALLAEAELGAPVHMESRIERFRPQLRARWREQGGDGSGLWWDLGPHLVDQALMLFGLPDTVSASFARQRRDAVSDDWAHVVLGFGERRALLHAGLVAAAPGPRFTVHCSRGSGVKLQADPQEAQLLAGLRPGAPGWGLDADDLQLHDGSGAVRRRACPAGDQARYYAAVCDAINGIGDNPVPPAQALAVMAVLEAAIESARSARVVKPAFADDERSAYTDTFRPHPAGAT